MNPRPLGYEPNDAHLCRPGVSLVTLVGLGRLPAGSRVGPSASLPCRLPSAWDHPDGFSATSMGARAHQAGKRHAVWPSPAAFRLQICLHAGDHRRGWPRGLPGAIAVDVHQVVADFMSVAADDLHRAEGAKLGMTDHGLDRRVAGGIGPLLCRRPPRRPGRQPVRAAGSGGPQRGRSHPST